MGRSCGRGPMAAVTRRRSRLQQQHLCSQRASPGAGLAPGVSCGVPWRLPESPSLEEQGLRAQGRPRRAGTPRSGERKPLAPTPTRCRCAHVCVSPGELPPPTPLLHARTHASPPTPGVALGVNTTLSASLTTDAGDAGDGAPDPRWDQPGLAGHISSTLTLTRVRGTQSGPPGDLPAASSAHASSETPRPAAEVTGPTAPHPPRAARRPPTPLGACPV